MLSTLTKLQAILDMDCVGVFVTRNGTKQDYGHSSVLVYVVEIMWSMLLTTRLREAMCLLLIRMLFTNQKTKLVHACMQPLGSLCLGCCLLKILNKQCQQVCMQPFGFVCMFLTET